MKIKTISDLYQKQKELWNSENEKYFGVSSLENWIDTKVVENHLNNCAERFWNNGTNELKKLFENGKCKDIDKLIPGSYELIFDSKNGLICLFASFKTEEFNIHSGEKEEKIKRAPLAYLPYANDLSWFLNDTEYVLRISATLNYSLISRTGNICKYQRIWRYDIEKDEFVINIDGYDPYEMMNDQTKAMLKAFYGSEITKDNFKEAMKKLPEFNSRSIMYFRFGYISEMFSLVSKSNRFANPLMRVSVPINIVKMFASQKTRDDNRDNGSFNNLVLSNNTLFALENARTVIYKSAFNSSFSFLDSEMVFDAFKTSTNKSAGRSRLILDNVFCKDNMLWNVIDGKEYNMYEMIANNNLLLNKNLSVLSCSSFSLNNDPKRIMMTAKLRAQAIPVKGEIDKFTHEVPARIVFGDFEGFNFGDSIIISKSFAKKLESRTVQKRKILRNDHYQYLTETYEIGDYITSDDFNMVLDSNMCANYRDIKILSLDRDYITVEARLPFSVGDKLTNFHASKGICTIILDDDKMPRLKNDISENFKAGPFEIIVSSLSVYRRKSLGQLFEAWALAMGITDVNNVQDAVEKYSEELRDFSNKSIVEWNGKEVIKPCGINMIIRLDHNAVTKVSKSPIKNNYAKMLKFGEMELLNLAARGLYDIINEIDIRAVSKHYDSFEQIKEMQKTGKINSQKANNLRFFNILKTIGFDFNLRNPEEGRETSDYYSGSLVLSDENIDLFKN